MNVGFTYEIRDKTNTDLVYYGSSEMPSLDDRLKLHLKDFKRWKNKNTGASYYSSFKVLELNNYKATLLKIVFFSIKWELREQERHLIEYQTCVNENIPNRTKAEYYQANKEKFKEYHAEHYQANQEKIKEYQSEYRVENKEKIKEYQAEYRAANKEYQSEHYQANREHILERNAEYYQANKEKIKEKFNCLCGGKYTHQHKSTHDKSKRHQNWLCTLN